MLYSLSLLCFSAAYCISHNTIAVSLICIWTGAMFWSVAPLLGWGSFTGLFSHTDPTEERSIRLYFKNMDRSFPIQKLEAKYPASNPGSDSGVNSPPRTPPTDPQGVIHADLPSHIETSQYWCDRLWGPMRELHEEVENIFCNFWSYPC